MTDSDQIRDLIAAYLASYEAHDAAGCAAVYADDAVVISPWGPPVRGRAGITSAHLDWFEEGEHNKIMTIKYLHIDGALASCLVVFSADVPSEDGGTAKFHGASLNTMKYQDETGWAITSTSLNEL